MTCSHWCLRITCHVLYETKFDSHNQAVEMVVGVMFKVVCARFVAPVQPGMRVMCPFNNVLRHFPVLAIQP